MMGTDDEDMSIILILRDGITVISSGVSADNEDSKKTESDGGGGGLSGGGFGSPNWESRSLCRIRQ